MKKLNMKKLTFALLIIGSLLFSSCQSVTKRFGGTTNIELEEGEKFINVTWKDSDIWVLVKSEKENAYVFKEYSNLGVLNGKVIIREKK